MKHNHIPRLGNSIIYGYVYKQYEVEKSCARTQ